MSLRSLHIPNSKTLNEKLFWIFGGLTLASIFGGIILDFYPLFALPAAILLLFIAITDYKQIYFLLMLFVPLSMEVSLGSLGTDLPTEPLLVGLMFIYFLQALNRPLKQGAFFKHPIIWLLTLHYVWIFIAMLFSSMFIVSLKFFLAKTWYIVVFVFMTGRIIKTEADFKKLFWLVFITLCLGTLFVLYQQSKSNFSFEDVNEAMSPFFRNHVNYAAILTLFFPFAVFALTWYKKFSFFWLIVLGGALLLLLGIQLSYTRTAYVALMLAFATFFILRLRLIKYAIGTALILAVLGIAWVLNHNRYLNFAPDYSKTITHYEFDDLVQATYKFQDISTMERVYRWVAGYQMTEDLGVTGFGPGNFYNFYKGYTVGSFRTYVSDNPEKSGIHNYYLMILVEQGFVGILIFLLLTCGVLIFGERIYHQTPKHAVGRRNIILAVLLSTIIIDAFLLINDLIEAAKIGAFYFINMAVLINMDFLNRKELKDVNNEK